MAIIRDRMGLRPKELGRQSNGTDWVSRGEQEQAVLERPGIGEDREVEADGRQFKLQKLSIIQRTKKTASHTDWSVAETRDWFLSCI